MRLLITLLLLTVFNCVLSKNNVKTLTESLGQEVIEIGNPLKELPPDLEEEPSAENYEEEKTTTSTSQGAVTKKDVKKTGALTTSDTRRKNKDADKTTTREDDEESRIEKELAEIYKDNLDYKDSSEVVKGVTTTNSETIVEADKPILRTKSKFFKFQPDLDNRAEIERFRTSVDEISCDKNRMKGEDTMTTLSDRPNSASANYAYFLTLLFSFISAVILNP